MDLNPLLEPAYLKLHQSHEPLLYCRQTYCVLCFPSAISAGSVTSRCQQLQTALSESVSRVSPGCVACSFGLTTGNMLSVALRQLTRVSVS